MMRIDAHSAELSPVDQNRWRALMPRLRALVAPLYAVYVTATPEQQAQLREHNPIFASVLDVLGI